MHTYAICNMFDTDIYHKQCAALEKNIPELKKERELEDVDGGLYMHYTYRGSKITVKNSRYTDKITIESEILLNQFFPNAKEV